MNPLIIVPTYASSHRRSRSSVTAQLDHATPLASPGELPRLFDSLNGVPGAQNIAVLVSAEQSIQEQAAQKVQVIASRYPDLNILVIGNAEYQLIRQRIEQLGGERLTKEISLNGYSSIRNLGLVLANAFGFDSVVFLDDDEVIKDPDFMRKAVYGLGKLTRKGIPILAKTGFFYNAKGEYLAADANEWYNRSWKQGTLFNEWIEQAMRGPRLSRSNHVCGGCVAIHREAFRRVAFDPWIPRGEDLDYLLNLRMYGSDMWFDNQWSLHHLPAKGGLSEGLRFKQDVFRWLYEYRKMEFSRTQIDLLQVKPESLEPYPGPFLQPGIKKMIERTITLRTFGTPDRKGYAEARKAAKGDAEEYAKRNCGKYFQFQFIWPELMNRIENDQVIQSVLVQSAEWRQQDADDVPQKVREGYTGESLGQQTQQVPAQQQVQAQVQQAPAAPSAAATVAAPQPAANRPRPHRPVDPGLDPGATTEIRLNLSE